MKIVCEKCDGKGSKMQIFQGAIAGMKCHHCKGKGYNEIAMTVEEVGRNGRIAQAIEMALTNNEYCIASYKGHHLNSIKTIDKLLEWADNELGINEVQI